MKNVDIVGSRFYASSLLLSGATEVVTVVKLKLGLPTEKDLLLWAERNAVLRATPFIDNDGYLFLHNSPNFILPAKWLRVKKNRQLNLTMIMAMEVEDKLGDLLWRMTLYQTNSGYYLAWRRNHLISDAFTSNFLLADLLKNSKLSCVSLPCQSTEVGHSIATTFTSVSRIDVSHAVASQINEFCKNNRVSLSSVIALFLIDALGSDVRGSDSLWIAYSRRHSLMDYSLGCLIGVAQISRCFHTVHDLKFAKLCDEYTKNLANSKEIRREKFQDSMSAVNRTFNTCMGACITNSGQYKELSDIRAIDDIATCVDRRSGNYSVVAHVDRFNDRVGIYLSSSYLIFTRHELDSFADQLSFKISKNNFFL